MTVRRHSIKQWPASERPREQLLLHGPRSLRDADLLAILLRTGRRGINALDLARDLLTEAGSLRDLAKMSHRDLIAGGSGPVHAATLVAAFELGRRCSADAGVDRPVLRSPEDVACRYGPLLRDLRHEEFWAVLLNSANRVEADIRISSGTLNASLAHPRECFAEAVQRRAASVIFIHNHPSGNPEPSHEDLALTRQLSEAGRILGIPVHDHVIIAGEKFTSLADRHLL